MFMFFSVFLVGTISAFEFDNIHSYNKISKTTTIINAFGFGSNILSAKLETPNNVYVGLGYQKVAEFKVFAFQDYTNILDFIQFYNLKDNSKEILRNYDLKYKVIENVNVPVYSNVCSKSASLVNGTFKSCSQIKTGTKIQQKVKWLPFSKSVKSNQIITVGIFTNVKE